MKIEVVRRRSRVGGVSVFEFTRDKLFVFLGAFGVIFFLFGFFAGVFFT